MQAIPDTAEAMRAACHKILAALWYEVGEEAQKALVEAQMRLEKVKVRASESQDEESHGSPHT